MPALALARLDSPSRASRSAQEVDTIGDGLEVPWVHACGFTAQVVKNETIWDRCNVVLVGPSMGEHRAVVGAELSVPGGIDCPSPVPAVTIWFDLSGESSDRIDVPIGEVSDWA